jgi:uncharacterized protein (TIGR00251 family)
MTANRCVYLIVATPSYVPSENNHKRYRIYKNVNIRDVCRCVPGGVEVNITVSPNSGRQGTEGTNEWRKRLIVRVRSPPLDGKANKEVAEFMEKITQCRSEITKGHTNRQKTVMIHGDPDEIIRSLEASP